MYGLISRNKDLLGLASEIFNDVSSGVENFAHGYPKVNTVENENDFRIDVYYPGIKKQDFKINVEKNIMTIGYAESEKKEEDGERFHFREFSKREFNRRFSLPEDIVKDEIKAAYEDGVLKVVIPKDKVKEKNSKFEVAVK